MKKILFIALLSIQAMAQTTEQEIQALVDRFRLEQANYSQIISLTPSKPVSVGIQFEKLVSGIAGECQELEAGTTQISIHPRTWDNLTSPQKECLVFHELGHCVLNKDHSEQGIMSPSILSTEDYVGNRDKYLSLFFN